MVAALNDVDQDQHGQHKVERGFGHRLDLVFEKAQVREVTAFADQHDADDQQHEQTEHFVHPVLFKERRHVVAQHDHQHAADHDR